MTFESLPTTVRNELIGLGDAFEGAWKAGRRPRIEGYLSGRTELERTLLFQMLLEIEVEHRLKASDPPAPGDYLERFEAYTEVIRTVLADTRHGTEIGGEFRATPEAEPDFTPPDDLATTGPTPPDQPPMVADSATTTVPTRIGPYQLIGLLGQGNFLVYLARDD